MSAQPPLLARLVLRAAPLDVITLTGERLAREGALGRAIQYVANTPALPDSKFVRAVVGRFLPLLSLDETLSEPLYALVARVAGIGDSTGGGILTYFIDDAHPLSGADEDVGGVCVWESRFLSDISTRVWPAAFDLARALATLLGQPPAPDAAFGAARQLLFREAVGTLPATVIELGAGTGLASLLAARALQQSQLEDSQRSQPFHFVATDGDRAGVQRCSENILHNAGWMRSGGTDAPVSLTAAVLDWSTAVCACGGCRQSVGEAVRGRDASEEGTCEGAPLTSDALRDPDLGDPSTGSAGSAAASSAPPMPLLSAALWDRASLLCGSDLVYGHDAIEPLARLLCAFLCCGGGRGFGGGEEAPYEAELLPGRGVEGPEAAAVLDALAAGIDGGRCLGCGCSWGSSRAAEEGAARPVLEGGAACPRAPRLALLSTTRRTAETYGRFVAALARHGLAYVDVTEALGLRLRASGGGWESPLVDLRGEAPGEAAPALRGDVRTAVILPQPAVRWALARSRS